jgi:hypothetical protein
MRLCPDCLKRGLCRGWCAIKAAAQWVAAPFVAGWNYITSPASVEPVVTGAAAAAAPQVHAPVVRTAPAVPATVRTAPAKVAAPPAAAAREIHVPVVRTAPVASERTNPAPEPKAAEEAEEKTTSEPVKLTVGHVALLAALGILLYINHSPWNVIIAQVAWESALVKAAMQAALETAKYHLEVLCRKWRWLASLRDWVVKVARQPLGKAILKQARILVTRKLGELLDWIKQLAEGIDIPARATS